MILLLAAMGCQENETDTLHVYCFSLGQADSILLQYADTNILIDAGEDDDGKDIGERLRELGVKKLDLLVITHFDKDHIGGIPELLYYVETEGVLLPDYERDSKRYRAMMEVFEQRSIPVQRLSQTTAMDLGLGRFTFYPSPIPYDTVLENDNELSIITALSYGSKKLLFMGDAAGAWLKELCYKGYDISCDILKMPHHGEWEADTAALCPLSAPAYAMITDSKKNPADPETLQALSLIGAEVLRTVKGEIHLSINGKNIKAVN